jgi:hypothetical protein
MLRNLVLAVAALSALGGLAAVVIAGPTALGWLFGGLIVLIGTVFERVRYKRLATAAPDARFERTPERFRDPSTGEVVSVYADPRTGERVYVKD